MGRRIAKGLSLPQAIEYVLKLGGSRDHDSDIDRSQLEQQPKIIQVAIEEGVFVVPFHFQCDFPFEAVDRMGWTLVFDPSILIAVENDLCAHLALVEGAIDLTRNRRPVSAGGLNF